jgi:hypothetical protein
MARAGDKADAQAFEVVVRVAQRIDFEFATIAGARIDLADAQGLAQDVQQFLLDARNLRLSIRACRAPAGADTDPGNLVDFQIIDLAPNS